LLRLIVPFALVAALIACAMISQPLYRAALVLQVAFYALSLVGLAGVKLGPMARASDAAFTFVVLNTAAVVAFANFVTGRKAAWTR
jgi:lipid-binding SYLF domain-containing protein